MPPSNVRVEPGDMREVLARLIADGVTVHSIVTDPPYHLTNKGGGPHNKTPNAYSRAQAGAGSTGFMGKAWDGGDIAFQPETWRLCYDLLPPGGHLLAFGGTRTYHRLVCAIEDAGFEVRDTISWLYGSGFPKSHNVGKAIDRAAGAERALTKPGAIHRGGYGDDWDVGHSGTRSRYDEPATDAARQWEGWGTALKPAMELICVARKPLDGTVAANVLARGTGAINIAACRVSNADYATGRWPANVVHDGSDEVVSAFPCNTARFFYRAKAGAVDRLGFKHPTVKPVNLIRWLVRLVTPPDGTVLDPFAGSGTTGQACIAEGFNAILVEREAEYIEDIKRRIAHVRGEDGALFAGVTA